MCPGMGHAGEDVLVGEGRGGGKGEGLGESRARGLNPRCLQFVRRGSASAVPSPCAKVGSTWVRWGDTKQGGEKG